MNIFNQDMLLLGSNHYFFSIISVASIDIVVSLMQRPYEIHASTSLSDVQHIFTSESVHYPTSWSRDMVHVLQRVRKSLAVKFFESILINFTLIIYGCLSCSK